jgi:glycosyltransferase involved in cell wall biosynthesis
MSLLSDLPRVMTLAADHAKNRRSSGYTLLADYLQGAEQIKTNRAEPKGLLQRATVSLLTRLSFTRWYRLGSAQLEWQAWRRLTTFEGVVHVLWADRDLGFIDLLRDKKRHRLCTTFHCSPETLSQNIHFPSRLNGMDAIILMSESQRTFFEAHGVSSDRTHVVLHGVDTQFFRPAHQKRSRDFFEVLFVGGYMRDFKLLQRICYLMSGDSSVRFKMISPQGFRHMFDDFANVEYVTGVAPETLLRAYQEASCFLLTVESATANNALLEAIACGLPVVTQRVGGIPEYVGDCAALVSPGSAEALANTIRCLVGNSSECERLGSKARARAEELDWTLVAERTVQIYRAIA